MQTIFFNFSVCSIKNLHHYLFDKITWEGVTKYVIEGEEGSKIKENCVTWLMYDTLRLDKKHRNCLKTIIKEVVT